MRNAITSLTEKRAAAGGELDAKNEALFKKLEAARDKLKPQVAELQEGVQNTQEDVAEFKEAKIRVSDIIYPGVVISFRDRMQYKTQDEQSCVIFYEEEAEIRTGPY